MEFIFFVIFSLVFAWLLHLWNFRAYLRLARKVPSQRLHTFLGFGKILKPKTVLAYLQSYIRKYGPTCVLWMGPYPMFYSTEPQILSEVLNSKNCVNKPQLVYNAIERIAGQGLITEGTPSWNPHRKLFNKAFTPKIIYSFIPIFHHEINGAIKKIDKAIDAGGLIDVLNIFRELTLNNASQTTLKRKLNRTQFSSSILSGYIHDILDYIALVGFNYFLNIDFLRKLSQIFIYRRANFGLTMASKLVDESVDILKSNNKANDPSFQPNITSVLDFALKGAEQNIMTMEEVRGEMLHIFAGAFETTSTTLYLVLLLLAMHPEYQDQVYEEVINVLPKDDETEVTLEQLNQLTYLEMVFYETLRILPVVPALFRQVSNEPLQLSNGLVLPVGQIILINIHSLNRCKKLWGPEADVFNPDNFLPQNVASRHPYQFIPFTKGQRVCIGMKYALIFSKMSLAKIIKKFKFFTDFKYKDIRPENHITLKLAEEPHLRVERREA